MLVKVTTISQFALTYFIEAKSESDALDEITMRDSGNSLDQFDEAGQEYIGEAILDATEITRNEFEGWLKKEAAKGSKSGASHWCGEKLIRKIDYSRWEDAATDVTEEDLTSAKVFRDMGTDLIIRDVVQPPVTELGKMLRERCNAERAK